MRPRLCAALLLIATACTPFPEVGTATRITPATETPVLLPLDALLTEASAGRASAQGAAVLQARADALRARAGATP